MTAGLSAQELELLAGPYPGAGPMLELMAAHGDTGARLALALARPLAAGLELGRRGRQALAAGRRRPAWARQELAGVPAQGPA